jgi:PAS domain S-box-containing protein
METRHQADTLLPSATGSLSSRRLGVPGEEQRLFDSLPVGIYRTTPDGRFLAVNRTLAEMLGFERAEELLETPAPSLWADPEERSKFLKRLEAEGVVRGYEMRARRRDGTVFWVKNTVRRIGPEEGGVYYEGVIEDLSERKRFEEALEEAERRHRAMLDASPEAIAIHREGRIVYANRAAARLLGASDAGELLGRAPLEFVHPDFRSVVLERMEQASRGVVVEVIEEKFLRLDGTTIDVEVAALPVVFEGRPATQVLVRDVTDRRRAERQIRESEARLAEAQRLARLGNWEWAVPEDRFCGSEEMYRLLGLEPGTDLDREVALRVVHRDDRERLEAALRAAGGEGASFACEVRVVAGGEVRTLQFNGKAERDSSGRVVRVVGTAQDVSERKRFEEALAQARDAALETARLKSAFLANMSHEIRTPLNVILGYAAILAEELGRRGETRFQDILGSIDRAGRRLLETVHNVLDLSKIETGSFSVNPRTLDVVALVEQAAHDFRPMAAAKGLSIVLEIEEPQASVRFDEYCLSQALANLLSNAVKFTR